jgi:hypothetical protein
MAIYKAEDVYVQVDNTKVLANTLSFQTQAPITEDRRLGKEITEVDYVNSGPQRSSMSMSFYVTGVATTVNPIFKLLLGYDFFLYTGQTRVSPMMRPTVSGNDIVWRGVDEWHTARCWPNGGGPFFDYRDTDGTSYEGPDLGTYDWPWENTWETGSIDVSRQGKLGCVSGSEIKIGTGLFASGAALTSLEFTIQPFMPVVCSASFEIYNPVTGTWDSSTTTTAGLDPSEIAHGLYSSVNSNQKGIDDYEAVTWRVTAERVPRYVVGKKDVHEIKTVKAVKEVSFRGWGSPAAPLADFSSTMTLNLKSRNRTVYTDSLSGRVIDDSFELPEAGLMSKNFRIVEIMV